MAALSDTQKAVLVYLRGAERASTRRIYRETGGNSATVQALAGRGLVEPCLRSSYRITEAGTAEANAFASETLMRFSYCAHCGYRDRYPDDADGIGRMCNGCGHFGSMRFIGVTDLEIAAALLVEFPEPTVNARGIPKARS